MLEESSYDERLGQVQEDGVALIAEGRVLAPPSTVRLATINTESNASLERSAASPTGIRFDHLFV